MALLKRWRISEEPAYQSVEGESMTLDRYQLIKATEKLPSPKGVALHILRLTKEENTTIDDITRVVESDPALSMKLLKIANSPVMGMSAQVASVKRATVLLGFRTVASLALGLSLVSDNRKSECAEFDYDGFWSESLACAVAANHISKRTRSFLADEVFTCALLSQIGRLAFASAYPTKYADILRFVENSKEELVALEMDMFGMDHHTLTAEMMADWHLPKLFVATARMASNVEVAAVEADPHTLGFAKLLRVSSAIAEVVTGRIADLDHWSDLSREAMELGIMPEAMQEVLESIRSEWHDAGQNFSVPTEEAPAFDAIVACCASRKEELASSA